VRKNRSRFEAEQDDAAVSTGFSLPAARDPLLDHAATKVRIDQSSHRAIDRFPKCIVVDILAIGKSSKRLGNENAHPGIMLSQHQYSTECYR